MRRKTFTITEHASGDDSNPYRGYLNNELYYAGPMSYIVKQGSDYYNIRIKEVLSDEALRLLSDRMNMFEQKDRNELVANSYRNTFKALYEGGEVNVTTKSTIRATTQAMVEVEDSSLTAIQSNSKTSTVDKFNDTEYYISNSSKLQNISFGNNVNGTCGSVACGIYLTYLDQTVDEHFVPAELEDAEILHQHLINYIENNTVNGSAPLGMKIGLEKYFNSIPKLKQSYDVSVDYMWLGAAYNFAIKEIEQDKPVIVCLGEILGSEYGDHSVVCYGYKTREVPVDNQGNTEIYPVELLVHLGWYGINDAEREQYAKTWINLGWVAGATSINWEPHQHVFTKVKMTSSTIYHNLECECGMVKTEPHSVLTWTTMEQPTCTKTGLKSGNCTKCNRYLESTISIDPLKHSWDEWKVIEKATCSDFGEEARTCKNNSFHIEKKYIPTQYNAHSWGEWKVEKVATCSQKGLEKRVCNNSSLHTETKDIPANSSAHDWGNWTVSKQPNCSYTGEETRVCKNSSLHKETRSVPSKYGAHDWGNWTVTKQPDCFHTGEETRTCRNDSFHKETKNISSIYDKHNWGEWKVTKAATCTQNGTETKTCKNFSGHTENRTIYGLGHNYSSFAQWYKVGSYFTCGEYRYYCTRSGCREYKVTTASHVASFDRKTCTKCGYRLSY